MLLSKYFTTLIIFILTAYIVMGSSLVGAHTGNPATGDNHYQVPFTKNDISMELSLSMKNGDIKEFNVSITPENASMTIIIEVTPNSGSLWGVYLENHSHYYSVKNTTIDPTYFCSSGVRLYCTKIVDHVTYYTVKHITRPISAEYTLAIYNTHAHEEPDTKFTFIILKGFLGTPTVIFKKPVTANDAAIVILLITGTTAVAGTLLVVYAFVLQLRRKRRTNDYFKKLQI
jgi:hypothetical protein